jgi:hypothetical protein
MQIPGSSARNTLFRVSFAVITGVILRKDTANNPMTYIHQQKDWPRFRWNDSRLLPLLAKVRHQQGASSGKWRGLGFIFGGKPILEQ